jgi:hypothetical protein
MILHINYLLHFYYHYCSEILLPARILKTQTCSVEVKNDCERGHGETNIISLESVGFSIQFALINQCEFILNRHADNCQSFLR